MIQLIKEIPSLKDAVSSLNTRVKGQDTKLLDQDKKILEQDKKLADQDKEIKVLKTDRDKKIERNNQLEGSMRNIQANIEKRGRFEAFIKWHIVQKKVRMEADKAFHPNNVSPTSDDH